MRQIIAITSMLATSILGPAAIAQQAQQQPPQQPNGQGFAPQGFAGRGLVRGGMMGPVDPTRSHAMELIQAQRTDVRSELHLDIKQKAALDELFNGSQTEIRDRVRNQFQSAEIQEIRKLPQDQQRAKLQEYMQANRAQMRADLQTWQGELNEKAKAILRPPQIKRLSELDFQYRGTFAMADPKVAEALKLTPEHRGEIMKIYGEFQSSQQQLMQEAIQKIREYALNNQQPQGGGVIRAPFNPEEIQSRMQPVMRKVEANKKEAEEKVLALLSPEEKQSWAAVQGEKFTFRKDLPPAGPRGNF